MDRIAALVAEEALLAGAGPDQAPVLPLTGAPNVRLPGHVRSAAKAAIDDAAVKASSRGLLRLRSALAQNLCRTWGQNVDPDTDVLVTNGAMHAISVLLRALVPRGREVIMPIPTFLFDGVLAGAGLRSRYVPPSDTVRWTWDVDAIEAAIGPETHAILVCNPENPSGYVPEPATVARLAKVASDRGLIMISDESYARFVYRPAVHTSFGALQAQDRLVVVGSMSKSYAMSSWRVGFLVAKRDLVSACLPVLEWDSIRCGYVAQAAAAAAVEGPQGWMSAVIERYQRNRDRTADMTLPGLPIPKPDGGAFLFLRLANVDALHRAGIPAVAGEYFKAPAYARIPFGGPVEAIEHLEVRLGQLLSAMVPRPEQDRV